MASKPTRGSSKLIKIIDASIGFIPCRGYTLVPGADDKQRQLVLNGCSIGDAPTIYTMTGLEPYELSVIGKEKKYNDSVSQSRIISNLFFRYIC